MSSIRGNAPSIFKAQVRGGLIAILILIPIFMHFAQHDGLLKKNYEPFNAIFSGSVILACMF